MKLYEKIEMQIIFLQNTDVIRTSQNDNVENMPDFPEEFEH